jgi:hypothetical protein
MGNNKQHKQRTTGTANDGEQRTTGMANNGERPTTGNDQQRGDQQRGTAIGGEQQTAGNDKRRGMTNERQQDAFGVIFRAALAGKATPKKNKYWHDHVQLHPWLRHLISTAGSSAKLLLTYFLLN